MRYLNHLLYFWIVLLSGCAGLRYQEPGPNDPNAIDVLQRRLLDRPDDAAVARDLGAVYVRLGEAGRGMPYLEAAFERMPGDPKTLFYMGLSTEMAVGMNEALVYYAQHAVVPASSPYKKMMRGRWNWLSGEIARGEMRARMEEEETLDRLSVDPEAVAVFPLKMLSSDERFAHLGRAFSELVMVDLASVPAVKVVERVRLQALLDELDLAAQGRTDPAVSPRSGLLLGAGRLTGGSLSVLENESLQVDFANWLPALQPNPAFLRREGRLVHFFDIEKEVVFSLLRSMDIELTPEEQERIERIPTQNMQAFLAYSRGLDFEDRGFFIQAEHAFREATTLDPGFQEAAEAGGRASDAAAGAGSAAAMIEAVNEMENGSPEAAVDLLGLRMSVMTGGAAGGEEGRQPAAEAASAGNPILADPPAPPNN